MLSRHFLLPLLFSFGGASVLAQETFILRYFHPVFSPTLGGDATRERGVLRALVIGVGHFQQGEIEAPPHARRDAEAFAAFLKTPAGGSVAAGNMVLLANEGATLAKVTNALDWITAESRQGDKIIVFVSTCGQLRERNDALLLFHDSPPAPTDAGCLALSSLATLLGEAAAKKGVRVFAAVAFTPFKPDEKALARWNASDTRSGLFSEKMVQPTASADQTARRSFGSVLLRGLLGLADSDLDEKVYAPELVRYLNAPEHNRDWAGYCANLLFSDKNDWLCKAPTGYTREKLAAQEVREQTPILQLEVQPLDGFMAAHADAAAQRLYEDFILTIRLGHLLTPPERCAALLLDSLLRLEALAPVHRQLQRRMAVAYQDETQQAINAYLQTSSQELARRRKDHDHYKLYPQYLRRTNELLGSNHFLNPLIEVKRLYFEALVARLEGMHHGNPQLFPVAMQHLWHAVEIESDAAFLFNEMGVVSGLMGHYRAAEDYFHLALERSPTWSIPQINLSVVLRDQNRMTEAKEAGITAIALGAWNPGSYLNLGTILQSEGDLKGAEKLYHRALKINPELPDAHYNIACIQALRGQHSAAIESLRKAIKFGFDQPEHIMGDKDLELLRNKPAFVQLMHTSFPDFRR